MGSSNLAVVLVLVLGLCASPLANARLPSRSLLQSATFANEETQTALSGARNATYAARTLLALANNEAELDIYNSVNIFLLGHGAGDGAEAAGTIGQTPAAIAAADASVAGAYATIAAILREPELVAQANELTTQAETEIAAVTEVDNSTNAAGQAATLALLGRAAHDGSLVLYWANETAGRPAVGETLNETVSFVAAVGEDYEQSLLQFVEEQLAAGGNPAVAGALLDAALHQMLGAIYVYRADANNTLNEQIQVSSAVRQAASIMRDGSTVDAAALEPFLTQAEELFAQGLEAADAAAAGQADPAALESLFNDITALDTQVEAALSSVAGAPALAPASSTASASSAGRR